MRSNIENSSHYDVVIVGAGPGGLRCAEILGQAGKKVLLLEKNAEIGPKVCAGGLSRKCVKLLGFPPELTERTFKDCVFKSPSIQTTLEFGEPFGWTVDRKQMGRWQMQKLKNMPVTVRTSAEVTEITPRKITINKAEKIRYNFLVGADGSNSRVRKFLKIPSRLIGVAFQYIVPKYFKNIEIYLDAKLFGAWYAWIFPYKGRTSIGYGCFPKTMSMRKARSNFLNWTEKIGIDLSNAEFQAHPINCDYRGWKFGNIFLVGDAAGLVSGFTGEGIYQALVSGEEAAKTIINPNYKPTGIREIRREVFFQNFLLVIVYLAGPFRNGLYNLVTYCVRNKFLARTLARILT